MVASLACAAICVLILWEPTRTTRDTCGWATLGVEGGALSILLFNQLLPIYYMGRIYFDCEQWENNGELFLLIFLLADYLTAIGAAATSTPILRFGRPARMFLVFYMNRSVRHCVHAAARTLPALADLLILLGIIIVVSALFAVVVFDMPSDQVAPDGSDDKARAHPTPSPHLP